MKDTDLAERVCYRLWMFIFHVVETWMAEWSIDIEIHDYIWYYKVIKLRNYTIYEKYI